MKVDLCGRAGLVDLWGVGISEWIPPRADPHNPALSGLDVHVGMGTKKELIHPTSKTDVETTKI